MVTLLRDGFGFDVHARDITFAYTVADSEVEWMLGMVLQLRAAAVSVEHSCTWVNGDDVRDSDGSNSDAPFIAVDGESAATGNTNDRVAKNRAHSTGRLSKAPNAREKKNATEQYDDGAEDASSLLWRWRSASWVQSVVKLLVSDSKLFSTI